ncbi:hypothetical protein H1Q59_08685 [Holosporaceae bacterium 'Namur']|nr:hypothetical protein [Holosporaceae bacterium 'Namur']
MDMDREGYALIVPKEEKGTPNEIKGIFNQVIYSDPKWDGVALYYKSWNIEREQGEKLHAEILRDVQNPPRYKMSGNENISGHSNTGSSKKGHSCFTWAREKLRNMEDPRIDMPSEWRDKIAAITSRHVGPKTEAKGFFDFISRG